MRIKRKATNDSRYIRYIIVSPYEEIKKQLDIVEVISEYIPLKRVGSSYSALCPFHSEKTPSFYVSPSKQIWKCFGCGKGGDVIKFVAEYENISYREAAKLLAERYGIDVDLGDADREGTYYSALRKIGIFYFERLTTPRGATARNYLLKERKLPAAFVKEFGLGYCGDGFESVNFARKEGIFEPLKELKHFYRTAEGKYRDFFHDRITIPIKNITGKVVAFGGRALGGEKPKYKNSPNSAVFQKEKTLYAVDRAKNYARDKKRIIVVEGYFDVIRLHSVGLGETVAPLGTTLTQHHARVIKKLAEEVVLLFDGDAAGRRAAVAAAKNLLKFPLRVLVVFLPEGEDPDSFVLKNGAKALRSLLADAKPFQEFLIERINSAPLEKKEKLIKLYGELANSIPDPVRRELWLRELRDKTGLDLKGKRKIGFAKKVDLPKNLTPREVDFLLGLLFLEKRAELDELALSEEARKLAEQILNGERENLPKWLFEADTTELERRFELARDYLFTEKLVQNEGFKELYELEMRIKRGEATAEDIVRFKTLVGQVNRKLYELFKRKIGNPGGGGKT
jgi:DNA primase